MGYNTCVKVKGLMQCNKVRSIFMQYDRLDESSVDMTGSSSSRPRLDESTVNIYEHSNDLYSFYST